MTDDAKPQAVQPPPIWDHQGDPRCVNSGCFNVRDHWINAPDSVPTQAVGDEVDASQGHDFRDPYEDCDERCVRHPVVNGDPGGDEHQDCPE